MSPVNGEDVDFNVGFRLPGFQPGSQIVICTVLATHSTWSDDVSPGSQYFLSLMSCTVKGTSTGISCILLFICIGPHKLTCAQCWSLALCILHLPIYRLMLVPPTCMHGCARKMMCPCVGIQMYQATGVRGFFKGFDVAMLRSFPANAACFVAYEAAAQLLGNSQH